MRGSLKAFTLLLSCFLVYNSGGLVSWAQPPSSSSYEASKDHIIFDRPGYDDDLYRASADDYARLKDLGITDVIPRKIATVKKGDKVVVLGEEIATVRGKPIKFLRVRYFSPNGYVFGYAQQTLYSPSLAPSSSPETCAGCPLQDVCDRYNLSAICQANLLENLGVDLTRFETQFKSEVELHDYFELYQKCGHAHLFESYKNEYRHYIRGAAKAFQVPEVLLACLLFKENQWDQGRSHAGAQGIAQIMPDNIRYISAVLTSLNLPPKKVNEYKEVVASYERQVLDVLESRRRGEKVPTVPVQIRRAYEYARRRLKNYDLAQNWKDYIQALEKTQDFKKAYKDKPWSGSLPTYFDSVRANTPPLAIGAAALYLKDIIAGMAKSYDEGAVTGHNQLRDFLTAVSGAYNLGPGTAAKLIRSPPPSTTDLWVKRLESNLETKKHMRSIRSCMAKGDSSAPLMVRSGRLVPQRACQ